MLASKPHIPSSEPTVKSTNTVENSGDSDGNRNDFQENVDSSNEKKLAERLPWNMEQEGNGLTVTMIHYYACAGMVIQFEN